MSQFVQIIFSWNRPFQLWGLVKSLLDNTDLKPEQIRILCRLPDERYRKSYQIIDKELGCQTVYQSRRGLWNLILEQIQGNEFVSLMVDDMMFFRKASYSEIIKIIQEEPEICVWSWCIGADLWTLDKALPHKRHWIAPWKVGFPYNYIFHENGSFYRKKDLEYWLQSIPKKYHVGFNLNHIEGYLSRISKSIGQQLGSLHAGPLLQTCTTWSVNRISNPHKKSGCYVIAKTKPNYLREVFEAGGRLDYSSLYERVDWLRRLNRGQSNFAHIVANKEATNLFTTLIKKQP